MFSGLALWAVGAEESRPILNGVLSLEGTTDLVEWAWAIDRPIYPDSFQVFFDSIRAEAAAGRARSSPPGAQ